MDLLNILIEHRLWWTGTYVLLSLAIWALTFGPLKAYLMPLSQWLDSLPLSDWTVPKVKLYLLTVWVLCSLWFIAGLIFSPGA